MNRYERIQELKTHATPTEIEAMIATIQNVIKKRIQKVRTYGIDVPDDLLTRREASEMSLLKACLPKNDEERRQEAQALIEGFQKRKIKDNMKQFRGKN